MRKRLTERLAWAAIALLPAVASAHISIVSGPAFADASSEVVFGVGHGCAGSDTLSVRVEIPAGVTGVRPMRSDFGTPQVETDSAGNVTAVSWTKPDAEVLPADTSYYRLTVRMKAPKEAFTTLYFPTHQFCRASDGGTASVDWVATPGQTGEPAPALTVVPARKPGWNRYIVPNAMTDLTPYFGDALIVWKGNSAWSNNPNTTAQINATYDVTALSSLSANDEVWVKY